MKQQIKTTEAIFPMPVLLISTFNEDGSVASENVVYENGKGTITFSEGEKLSLTWDDAEEDIAADMVFEYAS